MEWSKLGEGTGEWEPRRIGEASNNELWLSPISVWELLMLIERGRVEVDGNPVEWVTDALEAVPLREAPLTHQVAVESRQLRLKVEDPADRFLAATAKIYDLTLVTADRGLTRSKEFAVLPNR